MTYYFQTFILGVMDKLIQDVGFMEHENDDYLTIRKRSQTLNWACNLGHAECRQAATNMFVKHLEDPEANKYFYLRLFLSILFTFRYSRS